MNNAPHRKRTSRESKEINDRNRMNTDQSKNEEHEKKSDQKYKRR